MPKFQRDPVREQFWRQTIADWRASELTILLFPDLRRYLEAAFELAELGHTHLVASWMEHDAKVSLKHYAQTTEEHFVRAAGGAKSDAPVAQNAAQQAAAVSSTDSHDEGDEPTNLRVSATCCEKLPDAAKCQNGGSGIRTHERVSPSPVFKTGAFNRSAIPPESAF